MRSKKAGQVFTWIRRKGVCHARGMGEKAPAMVADQNLREKISLLSKRGWQKLLNSERSRNGSKTKNRDRKREGRGIFLNRARGSAPVQHRNFTKNEHLVQGRELETGERRGRQEKKKGSIILRAKATRWVSLRNARRHPTRRGNLGTEGMLVETRGRRCRRRRKSLYIFSRGRGGKSRLVPTRSTGTLLEI